MIRSRQRDPGAEALMDPRTVIQPATESQDRGVVLYATTEICLDGSITVNANIVGSNTLAAAGVKLSYGEDGAVNARQVPFDDGAPYTEFNIASDGTTMPAIYHGPYGPELIG